MNPSQLRSATSPSALPNSRGVLFTLVDSAVTSITDIWVLDLRSGPALQLIMGAARAWYLDPGWAGFLRWDGAVFAPPFDVRTLKATGTAVPLLEGVKIDAPYHPDMALAPDGSLLVLLGEVATTDREMVWVTRSGDVRAVDPNGSFLSARNSGWALSPDGTRLAIGIQTAEGDDIWIKELDDGPLLRLTRDPDEEGPAAVGAGLGTSRPPARDLPPKTRSNVRPTHPSRRPEDKHRITEGPDGRVPVGLEVFT